MNQEKIGKFIAKCRKEKKLTQQELSEKLGVTDRSISNWENGKNMPDLSLFKPLCDVLEISINDLLSGEKVNEKDYQEKLEENIVNTILKVDKRSKVTNRILLIIIIFVMFVLISIFLLNNIFINLGYDNDRMYLENHPKYGLRFISDNSCTIYSGKVDYIKVNNANENVMFISAKCTPFQIIKSITSNGISRRALNFKNDAKDVDKYYYTNVSLHKIKKADEITLKTIIDQSYELSEKN